VDRRYTYVYSVARSRSWKDVGGYERFGKRRNFVRDVERWDIRKRFKPLPGGFVISFRRLVEYQLRDEDLEILASFLPPLASQFLSRGSQDVPARPRRQVTQN